MITSVNDRCRAIATFRHVSVRLMETVARWTPITPEMEAKVMFGRHTWDFAQMTDALGKRTFELRQPLHYSLRPVQSYDVLLDDAANARTTGERIDMLYEGVLPGLVDRYIGYAAATDPILDEPSLVIVERIVRELKRQRDEAAALCRAVGLEAGGAAALAQRERSIGNFVAEPPAA